jgi:hypothetical protein
MTFNAHRLRLEMEVVTQVIDSALHEGWSISVFDGEGWTVERSRDRAAIIAALRTTDEDQLQFHNEQGEHRGWVRLIYGNLPWEVVNDYSTRLDAFMAPISKFCDEMEEREEG